MNKIIFTSLDKSKQYWVSIALIIGVSCICFVLSAFLGYRVTALILLVTVSLLAISFDILPVLLAAALSAFIWNYFFIPPRFTFHVDQTEDLILFIMYFIIAMINGVLTYKIRQVEKQASLKEEKANSVKLYNTLLNSLSHELRTPIAAIIGATDNLQNNANLSKDNQDQFVLEISKAAIRLNQQVENLLNISRLQSGHIQPKLDWVDINEFIYQTVRSVEENHPKRKINISIRPDLPLCYTDKGMLEQIVYNLLNNAAIHTASHCSINISAACHADLLSLTIEDSGSGFKNTNPSDVFNKFSRTKNVNTGGSGLGLSIVKGFTEALHGNVTLSKSSLGGAKFDVSFSLKTSNFQFG